MIAHTSSAAIRSGPPQRGASRKRSATVPRTPAPESHRARQALTVLRQIPSLSAVPSIPRPSPKSNTMRARIASCCGVKDARIRRSSPSRSSSLNSILAALRPISSLHREIIATENQTTENKSLICESELTPTCTSAGQRKWRRHFSSYQWFALISPSKGFCQGSVEIFDEGFDPRLELLGRAEVAATDDLADQDREPDLDLIEP